MPCCFIRVFTLSPSSSNAHPHPLLPLLLLKAFILSHPPTILPALWLFPRPPLYLPFPNTSLHLTSVNHLSSHSSHHLCYTILSPFSITFFTQSGATVNFSFHLDPSWCVLTNTLHSRQATIQPHCTYSHNTQPL